MTKLREEGAGTFIQLADTETDWTHELVEQPARSEPSEFLRDREVRGYTIAPAGGP